jgi:hypothetical protein
MIEALIHRVKIRQAEIKEALSKGVFNWDAYQRLIGEYQGMQNVMDMIDNMLEEERNLD